MIIGQEKVLQSLKALITPTTHFYVIVGAKGSGRKLLTSEICKILEATQVDSETSISDVRDIKEQCLSLHTRVLYTFFDADSMSLGARNALLKITEDAPTNGYFVMTLRDIESLIPTLRSRALVLTMQDYSEEELKLLCKEKGLNSLFSKYCSTPGDVLSMNTTKFGEFFDYSELIIDQIGSVSGANAFKCGLKFAVKDTDEQKWDPESFTDFFLKVVLQKLKKEEDINQKRYLLQLIVVTTKCQKSLVQPAISKRGTIDEWILDMRQAYRDCKEEAK